MIRAGIIGGAGYTGGELIRLLLQHPQVDLSFVHSRSQAGKHLHDVHPDLLGDIDLYFSDQFSVEVDVIFLCMGHGQSKTFLAENNVPSTTKVIDLSRDFRLKSPEHNYVYGLPELNRRSIQQSNRIANCGCFATAIQLALLPLAKAKLLRQPVHVQALTGSTGAGVKPVETTHFSWRNNNISVYKPFRHQHMDEIRQSLKQLQTDEVAPIHFLPVRGDFPRGIFATAYTKLAQSEAELQELYREFYQDELFVWLSDTNPSLKSVVNTNKCILYGKKIDDQWLVISMIDNLLKGASGQAVQNMNLMFGLNEKMGLQLKSIVY